MSPKTVGLIAHTGKPGAAKLINAVADELKTFSETAAAAKQLVKKLYLYANNHFSAKSVANAAMIKQQLGEPIDGEYPPEFLERYPELRDVIAHSGGSRPRDVSTSSRSDLPVRAAPEPRRGRFNSV